MERDIRSTDIYREVEAAFRDALGPAFGTVQDPSGPVPSPDGHRIAFTAETLAALEGRAQHRVCLAEADGSGWRQLTFGPNDDRAPRWSPDGTALTFLSDRRAKGRLQLCRLRLDRVGEAEVLTDVAGVVEYHAWSPDGASILLGVAGAEAEQADALGSGTVGEAETADAPWLPEVRTWTESPAERRRAWRYDVASGEATPLGDERWNVWEATWLGSGRVAMLVSEHAEEGAWYAAHVRVLDLATGEDRELLRSDVQLNYLDGGPDGTTLALVEARCSDRYIAAGELLLVDTASGEVRRVATAGADVTSLRWTADGGLVVGALRGLDSVILDVDATTGTATERWTSPEATGDFYPLAVPLTDGRVTTTIHSSSRPPTLVTIAADGTETAIAAPTHAGHEVLRAAIARTDRLSWAAPDGLEIQGVVRVPHGEGPFPLLVAVHGGPVWAYQDAWLGVFSALVLRRGYAIFCPNPRGSGGRGRAFADMVVTDMGGADSHDILSGIDHLVTTGLADPDRIGVYGGSYGGYMSAWLPAIDDRFKAAVSFSPVTDWVSQHFTSSLAEWDQSFVGGSPTDPAAFGRYSPVMRFGELRTPTLLTAGANDRATPPGQAIEMWQALRLQGVPAEVVIYPQEGHGVGTFPAFLDFVARALAWFDEYLPAGGDARS